MTYYTPWVTEHYFDLLHSTSSCIRHGKELKYFKTPMLGKLKRFDIYFIYQYQFTPSDPLSCEHIYWHASSNGMIYLIIDYLWQINYISEGWGYQCYRGKFNRVSVNFCSETNLLADVLNAPWHSDRWNDGQMEERAFEIKSGVYN